MELCQQFVLLDASKHLLKEFDCGESDMNRFLARFAVKHTKQNLSTTFVLTINDSQSIKKKVAAYYTLSLASALKNDLPINESLPKYPIPVTLLARLAVDITFQQRNLGKKTLITALRKAYQLSIHGLPSYGLVLDVLNDKALGFYQQFNFFKPLSKQPKRLFISMKSLGNL